MRVSEKCRRLQANTLKNETILTALRQNIEPLIAVATNYALLATQKTILPYVTKMRMSF